MWLTQSYLCALTKLSTLSGPVWNIISLFVVLLCIRSIICLQLLINNHRLDHEYSRQLFSYIFGLALCAIVHSSNWHPPGGCGNTIVIDFLAGKQSRGVPLIIFSCAIFIIISRHFPRNHKFAQIIQHRTTLMDCSSRLGYYRFSAPVFKIDLTSHSMLQHTMKV